MWHDAACLLDTPQSLFACRDFTFKPAAFLLLSPGMFLASPTLLPSTFTMMALTFATASWFDRHHALALAAARKQYEALEARTTTAVGKQNVDLESG